MLAVDVLLAAFSLDAPRSRRASSRQGDFRYGKPDGI
jgi:hypothetical protein